MVDQQINIQDTIVASATWYSELDTIGLKEAYELISEGILVTNDKGNIIYCNSGITRIFGYSTLELLGKSVNTLCNIDVEKHQQYINQYVAHPHPRQMSNKVIEGKHDDGTILRLLISLSYIKSHVGILPVAIITMVDEVFLNMFTIAELEAALANKRR